MARTVYDIYRNDERMKGWTAHTLDMARFMLRTELEVEMKELQEERPGSQIVMRVEDDENYGSISEYYYDEDCKKDIWNYGICNYEIKERAVG